MPTPKGEKEQGDRWWRREEVEETRKRGLVLQLMLCQLPPPPHTFYPCPTHHTATHLPPHTPHAHLPLHTHTLPACIWKKKMGQWGGGSPCPNPHPTPCGSVSGTFWGLVSPHGASYIISIWEPSLSVFHFCVTPLVSCPIHAHSLQGLDKTDEKAGTDETGLRRTGLDRADCWRRQTSSPSLPPPLSPLCSEGEGQNRH